MRRASTKSFDDFIVGKGQGFNMLLQYEIRYSLLFDHTDLYFSGPPGTGKTFTAEALAELLQLPLYAVCLFLNNYIFF